MRFLKLIQLGLMCSALFAITAAHAQTDTTDLLSLLEPDEPTTDYTFATFKSTRVINMHSIENPGAGVLDFRISHRFGAVNTGADNLWGLDIASMRLGFEYGVTDRIMVGFGRSNINKELDGFFKYKILRQSTGKVKMPISLSLFSSMVVRTTKWEDPDRKNYFTSRLFYCHQLLAARKFNDRLSLQIAPTWVHRNLVADSTVKHDVFSLGAGGRFKLTKRFSVNCEYFYNLPNQLAPEYTNSLSLGVDIETGGHVFQLHFTNSKPMNEKGFITETTGDWAKGDIMFGFNVSRMFGVVKRR
ncbi:MAG: hypothetical protein RLZZ262_13 [Bacteroidota bacterium]|jgi:hypothetical protein